MILGLGTDLVEIARIERALRNPRFLSRLLTRREIAERDTWSAASVAGRWAAKEAAAKAVPQWCRWHDCEILTVEGRPVLVPREPLAGQFHVSISHERTHAVAVVIWEREPAPAS